MLHEFLVNDGNIIKITVDNQSLSFSITVQLVSQDRARTLYNRFGVQKTIATTDHGMFPDFFMTREDCLVIFQGNMDNVLEILLTWQLIPIDIVQQIMPIWQQHKAQLQQQLNSKSPQEIVTQLASNIQAVFAQLPPDKKQMYLALLVQALQ